MTTIVRNAKSAAELRGDAVSAPVHYAGDGSIQCKDAMRSMMSGAGNMMPPYIAGWWAQAFQYLWRWRLKNGVEDLEKARECIGYMIDECRGGDA